MPVHPIYKWTTFIHAIKTNKQTNQKTSAIAITKSMFHKEKDHKSKKLNDVMANNWTSSFYTTSLGVRFIIQSIDIEIIVIIIIIIVQICLVNTGNYLLK